MQTNTGEHAAIVTGVSRGLGAALARELLDQGSRSWASGARLTRHSWAIVPLCAGRFAETRSADALLVTTFQDISDQRPSSVCLLNNAATIDPIGVIGQVAAAEIATAIATNLTAGVTLANVFCRVFTNPDVPRRIINISSGAAERALPGEAVYCIAKAGLEMLTLALAAEQTAPTFQAIALRPGVIDTDMQTSIRSQPPEALPVVELFKVLHRDGRLVPAATVAAKIVSRLVIGEVDDGRTYAYEDL